jgi:hypothetical protein
MSENYGMLVTGFKPKRLSALLLENTAFFKEFFGKDYDSTAMNPMVKINEVFCRALERLWVEQGNYADSTQLPNAEGKFLRDLALSMGKEAKVAQKASGVFTFNKISPDVIIVFQGTIIDNNSEIFLKEYQTKEEVTLPSVFIGVRNYLTEYNILINRYSGFTNFFNILDVEWVSLNVNGTGPLTGGGTDYTWSYANQEIQWNPVSANKPGVGVPYYAKVTGYSAYITAEAKSAGSNFNAVTEEVYNLQTPLEGIISVRNEQGIYNGFDPETDLELRQRLLSINFYLNNDKQILGWLLQLHRVLNGNVYTLNNSWFRTIIYPSDENVALYVLNESLKEVETRKSAGTWPITILRMTRSAGALPVTDNIPQPYNALTGGGVYKIGWVSANKDGSTPYIAGTDYEVYADYDNKIVWKVAGSNPGSGNQYFVVLIKTVELAETIDMRLLGTLRLRPGYNIETVNNEIFTELRSVIYRRTLLSATRTLLAFDIENTIRRHRGVLGIDELTQEVMMRVWKGSAGGSDTLPITGKGKFDNGDLDITWISNSKTGTSPYAATNYVWKINTDGTRAIDWAGAASQPVTNYPYYVKITIRADITPESDQIILLKGVGFTL